MSVLEDMHKHGCFVQYFRGLPVFEYGLLLHYLGGHEVISSAALVEFNSKELCIVTNSKFLAMPRKLQDGGFAHEVGHVQCGHLALRESKVDQDETLEMQIEADTWARTQGYDILGALRFLRDEEQDYYVNASWEVLIRIALLEREEKK